METGDGWLVRVRCPGGILTTEAMRRIGEVGRRFGSGQLDVTSRANLQIRGLAEGGLEEAATILVAAGLAAPDAGADARRAIVANPLAGHDPAARRDSTPVVVELVERLARDSSAPVPPKFGIVVDDGGSWPLERIDADIRLTADGARQWSVAVRGASIAAAVDDPVAAGTAAARLCAEHGRRMDGVVDRLGPARVLDRLGARRSPTAGSPRPHRSDAVGRRPHRDPARRSVVAAPFLGHIDATRLDRLIDVAEAEGVEIRLTPARSFALCGVHRDALAPLEDALGALGLLTDPTDPRAQVSACVGSRGCPASRADTWAEAVRLAGAGAGRVHLSGCAKGCGAPRGAPHLVATEGGRFEGSVA
jgi:precorrin-3B synthase